MDGICMELITSPFVKTQSKSRFHPSYLNTIVEKAAQGMLYVPRVLPVFAGDNVIGLMKGGNGTARFYPITHRQWCGFKDYAAIENAVKGGQ